MHTLCCNLSSCISSTSQGKRWLQKRTSRDYNFGILRSLQYIFSPSLAFAQSMIPRISEIDQLPMNLPLPEEQSARQEYIRVLFDGIAHHYDFLNHALSLGFDVFWRKRAIRLLRSFQPQFVLDVATGTGDLAIEAARTMKAQIIGIDISSAMLALGNAKVARKGLSEHIRLQQGSAQALDFHDNTFDSITVGFGVRNFSDVLQGLKEMNRVLKPGGVALILEFSKPRVFPFSQIYSLYFEHLLPLIGGIISRSRESYQYLPGSVKTFPDDTDFLELMHFAGFTKTSQYRLSFGIATIYLGTKTTATLTEEQAP